MNSAEARFEKMRIAWTSTTRPRTAGVVTCNPVGNQRTRVMLRLDFDAEGFVGSIGDVPRHKPS